MGCLRLSNNKLQTRFLSRRDRFLIQCQWKGGILSNQTILTNCFSISGWIDIPQAFLSYNKCLACLLLFLHRFSNLLFGNRVRDQI